MRHEHFSATTDVCYHVVEPGEPRTLEILRLTYGFPTEAITEIRREAREVGSTCAVIGFSGGRAETVILPPGVSCAGAFHAIAEKFGTRFDAEQVLLSPEFAARLGAAIGVYFHPAPGLLQ